jgi:hypothetical protein
LNSRPSPHSLVNHQRLPSEFQHGTGHPPRASSGGNLCIREACFDMLNVRNRAELGTQSVAEACGRRDKIMRLSEVGES